jgi:hypothetical protein
LPDVSPYIYHVKISGFTRSSIYTYTVYDISRLRVKLTAEGEKEAKLVGCLDTSLIFIRN